MICASRSVAAPSKVHVVVQSVHYDSLEISCLLLSLGFFLLSIHKEGRGVGGTLRRLELAVMGAWWALWACSVGACWHARLVRATPPSTRKNTSATTHRAALARQWRHFLASVGRLLMWNGVAFGRAVSSRCCLACSRRRTHGAY